MLGKVAGRKGGRDIKLIPQLRFIRHDRSCHRLGPFFGRHSRFLLPTRPVLPQRFVLPPPRRLLRTTTTRSHTGRRMRRLIIVLASSIHVSGQRFAPGILAKRFRRNCHARPRRHGSVRSCLFRNLRRPPPPTMMMARRTRTTRLCPLFSLFRIKHLNIDTRSRL